MKPNHSAEPIPGGRSGGSLGEVFCKHFPSRKPFVQRHSERFGEVGKYFPFFVIHPPSSINPLLWPRSECGGANTSYILLLTSSISSPRPSPIRWMILHHSPAGHLSPVTFNCKRALVCFIFLSSYDVFFILIIIQLDIPKWNIKLGTLLKWTQFYKSFSKITYFCL